MVSNNRKMGDDAASLIERVPTDYATELCFPVNFDCVLLIYPLAANTIQYERHSKLYHL